MNEIQLQETSAKILQAVDGYCVKAYDDGHRSHLGASQIGEECKRKLWYVFRWCFRERFDGRMLRLFNRGHREEARFIEWLEGIGAKVWATDESGRQHRISDVLGHFGGSMDGICRLPPEFGIDEEILLEFKTNGTGPAFKKLYDEGLKVAKPQHWAQVCTYGKKRGLRYALYMNICKNDDKIHCELAKLDHGHGERMIIKAEQIITSQTPPAKLSNNSTFFGCKFCAAKDICHNGAEVERNCRSCKFAKPVENAEWFCAAHNGVIPKDFLPKGCGAWGSVNDYV